MRLLCCQQAPSESTVQGKLLLNEIHLHPKWFGITISLIVELVSVCAGLPGASFVRSSEGRGFFFFLVWLLLQDEAHGEMNNTAGSFKSSFVVKNCLAVCSVFHTKVKRPSFTASACHFAESLRLNAELCEYLGFSSNPWLVATPRASCWLCPWLPTCCYPEINMHLSKVAGNFSEN